MIRLTIYSGAGVVGVKALLYIGLPIFILIGVPNFYIREAFYLIG